MKKVNSDLVTALFSTMIALVFFVQSFTYSYTGPTGNLGPGFFSIWLSGIFLFLSLLYAVQSLLRGKSSVDAVLPKGVALKNFLLCIASMVIFAVLFYFVGFIAAGTVFLFILLYRAYKWYISLGISLVTTLIVFWLFGSILHVALPGFQQWG